MSHPETTDAYPLDAGRQLARHFHTQPCSPAAGAEPGRCTSRPANRTGPWAGTAAGPRTVAVVAGVAGWGRAERGDFSGSTVLESRSM